MMLNEYMIFVNWYTMRGYCHTIPGCWHTILISSYASNPWGTEDLGLLPHLKGSTRIRRLPGNTVKSGLKAKKVTTLISYQDKGCFVVEVRRIELLSEDPIAQVSPSAGCVFDFPRSGAHSRAQDLGSFMIPASPQSFGGPVPHINDAGDSSRERLRSTRSP